MRNTTRGGGENLASYNLQDLRTKALEAYFVRAVDMWKVCLERAEIRLHLNEILERR